MDDNPPNPPPSRWSAAAASTGPTAGAATTSQTLPSRRSTRYQRGKEPSSDAYDSAIPDVKGKEISYILAIASQCKYREKIFNEFLADCRALLLLPTGATTGTMPDGEVLNALCKALPHLSMEQVKRQLRCIVQKSGSSSSSTSAVPSLPNRATLPIRPAAAGAAPLAQPHSQACVATQASAQVGVSDAPDPQSFSFVTAASSLPEPERQSSATTAPSRRATAAARFEATLGVDPPAAAVAERTQRRAAAKALDTAAATTEKTNQRSGGASGNGSSSSSSSAVPSLHDRAHGDKSTYFDARQAPSVDYALAPAPVSGLAQFHAQQDKKRKHAADQSPSDAISRRLRPRKK